MKKSAENMTSKNNLCVATTKGNQKLSADMFFTTTPNEFDIKMFNYFNNLPKKDLMYILMGRELGNNHSDNMDQISTEEWCNSNKSKVELLPKKRNTNNKKKKSKQSSPKPSAKHIYSALKHYDTFTKNNQKNIDLINKTCFGIQLLKHPYENEVFMIADFQTLFITEKDKKGNTLKKPTLKHQIALTNELGKYINKLDSMPNSRGYGEEFKEFIQSILDHEDYDKDDFTDEKITIAQLDKDNSFTNILRKEQEYNNNPKYILQFLNKYITKKCKSQNKPLNDCMFKCKYLFNNTMFSIVNIDMFLDNGSFMPTYWDRYMNYTGNITLKGKDQFVENTNWYDISINYEYEDTNDNSSNSDNSDSDSYISHNDIMEEANNNELELELEDDIEIVQER